MTQINLTKVALDDCFKSDSLNQVEINTLQNQKANCDQRVNELLDIVELTDSIKSEKELQVKELAEDLDAEKKNSEKLKKRGKVLTFVGTTGGILVGGSAGFLVGRLLK